MAASSSSPSSTALPLPHAPLKLPQNLPILLFLLGSKCRREGDCERKEVGLTLALALVLVLALVLILVLALVLALILEVLALVLVAIRR